MVIQEVATIFTYEWISDNSNKNVPSTSTTYTQTILVTLIALVTGRYLQYRWQNRRFFKLASKFKGPYPLPLLGNAYMFAGGKEETFEKMYNFFRSHNTKEPARFWLGNEFFVAISKPSHMKAVLTSPNALQKPPLYSFINNWLGEGLFSAAVPIWKRHRKALMPTFNQKILDSFISIFQERSDVLVEKMGTEADYFDVFPYVSRCTLDSICETALGIRIMTQEDGNCKYVENATKVLELVYQRMIKLWYHSNFIYKFTSYGREQQECIKYLHNFTDSIIKQKRNEFNEMKKSNTLAETTINEDEPVIKRKAFLQLLMETSDFTDEEIRNEVDTITVAGNDTTATVNSFSLLILAMYPEVQEKVFKEIYEIVGDTNKPIDLDVLPKLKYTELVIKETMRLFPVGPLLARHATEEIQLDDNYTIPKGSSIAIGIYYLHRDPALWSEPEVFDPNRFSPEEIAKRDPYSYLPFSGGPRNCIGIKYAYMAMKILIATVIRNYKLSTDLKMEDLKLISELTIKLSNDFRIKLEKRHATVHSNS